MSKLSFTRTNLEMKNKIKVLMKVIYRTCLISRSEYRTVFDFVVKYMQLMIIIHESSI